MKNTNMINTLPIEVQEDIKKTLRAYDKVTVSFEYGKYHVSTGTMLKAVYGQDHKVLGYVTKEDIYTAIEQMENYINVFHDYPYNYKGKRNYPILKEMVNRVDVENKTVTNWVGRINEDGNFELTHEVVTEL